jgi:hypothetical protein
VTASQQCDAADVVDGELLLLLLLLYAAQAAPFRAVSRALLFLLLLEHERQCTAHAGKAVVINAADVICADNLLAQEENCKSLLTVACKVLFQYEETACVFIVHVLSAAHHAHRYCWQCASYYM